jgi:hypothetical protein
MPRLIIKSKSPTLILKAVKMHLDDVISGDAPCGADERSLSSYAAIRALIESLEEHGVDTLDTSGWDCPTAPDGKCHYSGSFDHCDYCGMPEERK